MIFNFNIYSSLLLPAATEGLLFFVLLYIRGTREERLSDKLLALLILCITLIISSWMFGFAGWYDSHDWHTIVMFYFPFTNIVFIGPLFYFYFLSLTNNNFSLSKKDIYHFLIPSIFLGIYVIKFFYDFIFLHLINGNPLPQHFGTKGNSVDIGSDIELIAGYVSLLFYLFLTYRSFSQYRKYVTENFSQTDEINFKWLWRLFLVFTAGITLKTLFSVFGNFVSNLNYIQLWYSYLILSVVIYYLCIEGYNINHKYLNQLYFIINSSNKSPVIPDDSIKNINHDLSIYKEKILSYMMEYKPYLEPELTLNELSNKLGLSRSDLSKTINEVLGQNFNDFVNLYRVDEVKKNIKNGTNIELNLLGIAFQSGFNSKATFNRSFKKLTGMTPKQYISGLKS